MKKLYKGKTKAKVEIIKTGCSKLWKNYRNGYWSVDADFMEDIWCLMKDNDMTPKQVAMKAGMSLRTFIRLSSSETKLTTEKMDSLARVFDKEVVVTMQPETIFKIEIVKNTEKERRII